LPYFADGVVSNNVLTLEAEMEWLKDYLVNSERRNIRDKLKRQAKKAYCLPIYQKGRPGEEWSTPSVQSSDAD